MSKEKLLPEDDPDTYLIESSVPDVRTFEQKTRYCLTCSNKTLLEIFLIWIFSNDIEFQKKELRAMVG